MNSIVSRHRSHRYRMMTTSTLSSPPLSPTLPAWTRGRGEERLTCNCEESGESFPSSPPNNMFQFLLLIMFAVRYSIQISCQKFTIKGDFSFFLDFLYSTPYFPCYQYGTFMSSVCLGVKCMSQKDGRQEIRGWWKSPELGQGFPTYLTHSKPVLHRSYTRL